MEIEEIKKLFEKEFSPHLGKFRVYDLSLEEAEASRDEHIAKPGVYVWWRPSEVLKVGRNLMNSRKRALEHVRDNTGGIMAGLREDPSVRLLLFNVTDLADKHWPAALEIFFEERLGPVVPSKRLG